MAARLAGGSGLTTVWFRWRYDKQSHLTFRVLRERILGLLSIVYANPIYPNHPALCEKHFLAQLGTAHGRAV